jgi:glycosyltransferase involved in cell wall biosynthesis
VLVSVVTPTLNARRYLEPCVRSVLGQSYPHIEHLFVDGESTDGTLELLREYAGAHPDRVRLIIEPGTGPGAAWNTGLKAARGEIFGCLGADDLYEPGAIDTVVGFFRANPEAAFVHAACDLIDAEGRPLRRHTVEPFDYDAFVNTARHIATPSAFYRRVVMERIGWLDASGDDFDVMLRIAREFEIHGLPAVLARLRIRPDSAFNRLELRKRVEHLAATYRVSRAHGGSVWSPIACRFYGHWILHVLGLGRAYPALRRWSGR